MDELKNSIIKEAFRIEEDTNHSARCHFNAAARWESVHYKIGLPSVIAVALSGGAFIGEQTAIGITLAAISTGLTTTLTFLKPSEKAETHSIAGNQYLSLRNQTRIFREVDLLKSFDVDEATTQIKKLAIERDDLNQNSPSFSRKDYEKAKKSIEGGETTHGVDS